MLLWLNLKSFFSDKLLSAVFCILLVVCLTGGLFGINYACCNVDYYNNYVSEQKLYTIYNSGNDVSGSVENFLQQYSGSIDYAMADLNVEIDGESYKISAAIYVSDLYFSSFPVAYGERLSEEDISNGARKIVLDLDFGLSYIGKTITILGDEYEVTGLMNGMNLMSYYALSDKTVVETIEFSLTEPLATSAKMTEFETQLSDIFQGFRIAFPDNSDLKSIFDYAPMMLPTLILVILGFINLGFLYVFFIKMRKRQYSIFRIQGAGILKILALFIAEMLLLYTAAYLVAIVIFKIVAALAFSYTASSAVATILVETVLCSDSMTFLMYLCVYAVLAVLFLVSFLPSLLATLKRDISV